MSTTQIRLTFEDGCNVAFAFAVPPVLGLSTVGNPHLDFDVGTVVYADVSDYAGPYEATPTQSTQVFATEGRRMLHDFMVNPIPHNYGLITYNGSTIMVS